MKKDKYFIEYQCGKCGYKGEQASLQVWEDEDGEVIDSTECCTRCGEYEKFYKWSAYRKPFLNIKRHRGGQSSPERGQT